MKSWIKVSSKNIGTRTRCDYSEISRLLIDTVVGNHIERLDRESEIVCYERQKLILTVLYIRQFVLKYELIYYPLNLT